MQFRITDGKAEFSAVITPVFSVTWSFRNHSNMLIWCSLNISYYYQCWNQWCCLISVWKLSYVFIHHSLMNRKFKTTAFICNSNYKCHQLVSLFVCVRRYCWLKNGPVWIRCRSLRLIRKYLTERVWKSAMCSNPTRETRAAPPSFISSWPTSTFGILKPQVRVCHCNNQSVNKLFCVSLP